LPPKRGTGTAFAQTGIFGFRSGTAQTDRFLPLAEEPP
jgi:hypothetical protein